ncbi:MAG: hypothetical protein QOJ81_1859 [Chloroflexota bacterium]|jgi:hypothetical protein|nr:hypothetical protein [Chloroflexota bacterium]
MRQRLAIGWTLAVLLLALMLPAATSAATYGTGYSYQITHMWCYGQNGPQLAFEVKNKAAGTTDANRLTIDSWAERRPASGGSWTTFRTWPRESRSFPTDGTNHSLKVFRYMDISASSPWQRRVVMQLRGWHNSTVRASTTIHSVVC